jgi:hypothetical protein
MENKKKKVAYAFVCKLNFQKPLLLLETQDEGFDRVDFEEVADVCD